MQNALPLGTTTMAAVIGLDRDKILSAIKDIDGVCEIANYNCPGQIVITGDNKGVDEGKKRLDAAGALKVVALNVSGAFHSSLLKDASTNSTILPHPLVWVSIKSKLILFGLLWLIIFTLTLGFLISDSSKIKSNLNLTFLSISLIV